MLAPAAPAALRYQPRRADASPFYRLVLDHHEPFAAVYDDVYAARYGDWRPEVLQTFRRFLDCGILVHGFLRVRCSGCGHEVRVPWSCKKVAFCPSCAQRRALEFGEYVDAVLFEEVPYRHVVFTVPRLLRPLFLRERRLLGDLARCGWEAVRRGLAAALGREDAVPGAVTAQASLGDSANLHPHIHGMFAAGAWLGRGSQAPFAPWPAALDGDRLTELFRRLVLGMLVRAERLSTATAERLLSWEHSGFSAFIGEPVQPYETESRRRLARYLVKAPLSLERIRYDEATCEVRYGSPRQGRERRMSALDFLAEISVVIPDRGQHMVSQWGRHSNRSRGERRKQLDAEEQPAVELPGSSPVEEADPAFVRKRKRFRLAWAQLLRRVWGPNVLACPRCAAPMQVLGAVTKPSVVERILRHLGLFDRPRPPNVHACPTPSVDATGQGLLAFLPRQPVSRPAPPLHPEETDPRLNDDWPVDPPFEDD